MILFFFYNWVNWVIEKLSNLPKANYVVEPKLEPRESDFKASSLKYYVILPKEWEFRK